MRSCVTALPSRLESNTRRRLLPTLTPKPRSNGSATNLPYVPLSDAVSHVTWLGSSSPRHRICIFRLHFPTNGYLLHPQAEPGAISISNTIPQSTESAPATKRLPAPAAASSVLRVSPLPRG